MPHLLLTILKTVIDKKMKTISMLILFISLTLACSQADEDKTMLLKSKMISILNDIHIAESEIAIKNLPSDSARLYFYQFQKGIFEKHDTDSTTFNKSFKYYLSQGVLFDQIYGEVVDSLGLKESKLK